MKLLIDISKSDYDWIKRWAKDGTGVPVYDTLARYIANGKVLSEEQEPKTAHWIKRKGFLGFNNDYGCSSCRHLIDTPWEYCPYCGAKMR